MVKMGLTALAGPDRRLSSFDRLRMSGYVKPAHGELVGIIVVSLSSDHACGELARTIVVSLSKPVSGTASGYQPVKVSVVTDEISSDLESALGILRAWGVDAVELRSIGAERFPEVADYWHVRLPGSCRNSEWPCLQYRQGCSRFRRQGVRARR